MIEVDPVYGTFIRTFCYNNTHSFWLQIIFLFILCYLSYLKQAYTIFHIFNQSSYKTNVFFLPCFSLYSNFFLNAVNNDLNNLLNAMDSMNSKEIEV